MGLIGSDTLRKYAVSVAAVGAAALLIRALQHFGYAGLSPLFAALIVSAWYGGIGPGVVGILLSTLAAYFLLPKSNTGQLYREDFLRASVFTITAMLAMAFHLASRRTQETALRARRHAEAANEAKTRLLAMVSHDLRNPLNPIRMAVALAEQDPLVVERAGEHLALIRDCVAMQGRLIDDLMDVARLATGKFRLSLASVNVHSVLKNALLACEAARKEKRISIEVCLDACRTIVCGDPFRLQQVLWNLLQNAIRFTPPGGFIWVHSFESPAEWISVDVRDNGAGIEPEKLPAIFKAFEQVGEDATRTGGLGLGLTICRGIVDAHDGTISASSAGPGAGAVFTVRLPLLISHRNANPSGAAAEILPNSRQN